MKSILGLLKKNGSRNNCRYKIVTDITRFGRNWGQSGYYFGALSDLGVRFISKEENIDTANPNCPGLKVLPFYFVFAEWYSASISGKIRSVFEKQNEEGKHRCYRAPYGYDKDPDDKYKLVIDPMTSPTVKRIFEMRLDKMSYGSIARILNDDGVPSPNGHAVEKYDIENKKPRHNKWSANSIIDIISNPEYCGDVVQNRVGCADYKNQKQVRKPREDWVTIKDKHEAIISREDFQKCADMQENVGRIRSTQYADISPFTGLLKCADCEYKMARTSTYYTPKTTGEKKILIAYNCGARANMGKTVCSSHYILEKNLTELVLADIRDKAGEILQDENAAKERYYAIKSRSSGTKLNTDKNALKRIEKRLAELDKLIKAAFEKSVLDDTYSEYEQEYKAEKQELMKQAEKLSSSIDKYSKTESDVNTFITLMKKYVNITELDRATAVELIDHITVSASTVKPREIVIYYNFMGNVE